MNYLEAMREYMTAYATKDLAAVSRLLAEAVVLQDWNLRVEGRAAVLLATARNFEAASSIEIQVRAAVSQDRAVAAELDIVVDRSVKLQVVDVLRFNPEGKIVAIRAYKG